MSFFHQRTPHVSPADGVAISRPTARAARHGARERCLTSGKNLRECAELECPPAVEPAWNQRMEVALRKRRPASGGVRAHHDDTATHHDEREECERQPLEPATAAAALAAAARG